MGSYLRDMHVKNISVDASRLEEICDVFESVHSELNSAAGHPPAQELMALFTYTIRYDLQGDRLHSRHELMNRFRRANNVERIVLTVETVSSMNSNRRNGTFAELTLDKNSPNCFLTVSSDNLFLIESTFSRLSNLMLKYSTKYGIVRSSMFLLLIQLIGVSLFFILSAAIGRRFSWVVTGENGFLLVFVFVLIVFSNLWTYIHPVLLKKISVVFPIVEFDSERRRFWHWTIQAIVGALISGFVLLFLGLVGNYLFDIVKSIFVQGK